MSVVRTRMIRWLAPVAVVAVIAAGTAWRSVAANAAPALPRLTAQQLLTKVAQSKVQSLSGVVAVSTDLGLPALPSGGAASAQSLLTGGTHTLRVYADGPDRQRVDLLGTAAETDVVHNGRDVWQWSSSTRTATHTVLPARRDAGTAERPPGPGAAARLTPQAMAQQLLTAVGPSTAVSVGRPASIAGRSAYDLRLTPRSADSTVGHADLYVDSSTGLVLCVGVTPRGASKEAVDVRFTSLRLAAPARSVFSFTPPPGAHVKQTQTGGWHASPSTGKPGSHPDVVRGGTAGSQQPRTIGTGWATVVELPGADLGAAANRGGQQGGSPLGVLSKASRSVAGAFGSGRLLSTSLVSVLLTDDGRVFVGAVTPSALLSAAGSAGHR